MVGTRRFHWNKILIAVHAENDADIRAALLFIILHARVVGMHIANISIGNAIDFQIFHNSTFPAKKEAGRENTAALPVAHGFPAPT